MDAWFYIFAAGFVFVWVALIMWGQRARGYLKGKALEWIGRRGLVPLLWLAAVGFVCSVVVHVASLFGIGVGDQAIGLHFGIFLVFVPGLFLNMKNGRSDIFSALPKWASRLISVLFVYALVNFFVCVSKFPPRGTPKNDPRQPTQAQMMRAASGHWMLFYGVGFCMMWNARRKNAGFRQTSNAPEFSVCL